MLGKPATDISGIACMPPVGMRRTCLLVNEENTNAQFATIDGDHLIVGKPIVLIRDEPDTNPKKTLGKAPDVGCPNGVGDFGEFDGLFRAFFLCDRLTWLLAQRREVPAVVFHAGPHPRRSLGPRCRWRGQAIAGRQDRRCSPNYLSGFRPVAAGAIGGPPTIVRVALGRCSFGC